MEDGKKSNAWAKQGDVNCEERGRGLGARRRNGGKKEGKVFCVRQERVDGRLQLKGAVSFEKFCEQCAYPL
jgi:hypothetical protein